MILAEIALATRKRVAIEKSRLSLELLKEKALSLPKGKKNFEGAIKKTGVSFICEVKKASPSKGVIDPVFNYLEIAEDYQKAGGDAISCLTEPTWFLGSDEIFEEIRKQVVLPMLRKDFMVDAYQLYQAKVMGADAVLLICALLDTKTIASYLRICEDLGLSALVETHDEKEIRSAVEAGATMIGVNNRNLMNFSVDISNSARLRDFIPPERCFIAESGVTSPKDVEELARAGADGILVGECLMRSADRRVTLAQFRKVAERCR